MSAARTDAVREWQMHARFIGSSSVGALTSQNPLTVKDLLEAMKVDRRILGGPEIRPKKS